MKVSNRCPGCGQSMEFEDSIFLAACGSCGLKWRVFPTGAIPPMHVPSRLDASGAASAAREAIRGSGTDDVSIREATLFYLPFSHATHLRFRWVVQDIVGAANGSMKVEPRPLLGYGEDVLAGLLIGGGRDVSDRKLELTAERLTTLSPMASLEGIEPDVSEPSVVSPLPSPAPGFLTAPDSGSPTLPKDVPNIEAHVSPRHMTVYLPFWFVEVSRSGAAEGSLAIVDGTDGSVLSADAPLALLDRLLKRPKETPDAEPLAPPACPDCGGAVVGGEHDAVVFCPTCRKAYGQDGPIEYTVMEPPGKPGPGTVYMPVWAVEARLVSPERVVDSRDELFRISPGKGWPKEEDKRIPMMFFMPAFGLVNMKAFSRASADMTRSQPLVPAATGGKAAPARGCLLGPGDAKALSTLMLYSLVPKGNKVSTAFALAAMAEPASVRLLLTPFEKTKYDYRDTVTGVSIPISAFGE